MRRLRTASKMKIVRMGMKIEECTDSEVGDDGDLTNSSQTIPRSFTKI